MSSDFSEFIPPRLETNPAESKPQSGVGEPEVFILPGHFWASLNADKAIHSELDRVIGSEVERKVSRILEGRFEELKSGVADEARKTAHEAGYAKGRAEGLLLWKEALEALEKTKQDLATEVGERLNRLSQAMLVEKEKILQGHQKIWCQALGHLLKRFLIRNATQIGRETERWLVEVVSDFASRKKVQIYLSEKEFERAISTTAPKLEDRWELVQDSMLKDGEVRYECAGGGVFFSPSEEMEKLDAILDGILSEGGSKDAA